MPEKYDSSKHSAAQTKETKPHGSSSFPIAAYHAFFPENHAFSDDAAYYLFNAHWHEEFELCYLPYGNCTFCIDGKCYSLQEGDAILVPSNALHWAYKLGCRTPSAYTALVFHPSMFTGYASDAVNTKYVSPVINGELLIDPLLSRKIPWQSEAIDRLLSIFEFFDNGACEDNPNSVVYSEFFLHKDKKGAELKIKSLLFDLWYLCIQHAMQGIPENCRSRKHQEQINQAIQYIHTHYNEKFTLNELASSVYMSKDYFSHIFKEYTRSQPFTYLNSYRVRKSIELLDHTDYKIIEIANLCGFEHVSYFNRKFSELMKCTPSEYRRNRRKITDSPQ